MNQRSIIFMGVIAVAILAAIFFIGKSKPVHQQSSVANQNTPNVTPPLATIPTPTMAANQESAQIVAPISNALSRITKKPFGIYVTPQNSPVQPERFTGYHTGVDFETTPDEQNIDVPISAICTGPLVEKKWASGYGGVAVQRCIIENQAVTVVYGHLNVGTITPNVGDQLKAGDHLALLGKGYSQQTDGERKHLHLGIHIGTTINILGYVQNKSDLSQWLDAQQLLSK